MRLLLVSSNLYGQFAAVFPNGVAALSAYLTRLGHDVHVRHLFDKRDLQRLPAAIAHIRPDVFGISAMTCEARLIGPLAKMAKDWNPKVPVLVGGIHAIMAPDAVARIPNVDGVCAGEGEKALEQYLDTLQAGGDVTATPNFVFLRDDKIIRNKRLPFLDINELPFFDRSVTDLQRVIDTNQGSLNLIFSRGCPWNCRFCGNHAIRKAGTGEYVRLVRVDRAMQELEALHARYRFSEICFRDDTFTWNRKWALEFLGEYKKRFRTPFAVFVRVDTLDREMVDALKAAGCTTVFIGLDSGSDKIRNEVLRKEQDNAQLFEITDYLKQVGIAPVISNIVGLPHETPDQFRETIEINKRIYRDKVVFSASFGAVPKIWVFSPFPGSELHDMCAGLGWLKAKPELNKVYRDSPLEMPQFPREQVLREFRLFRWNVYKDNHPLWALAFRVFDSRPVQAVYDHIPFQAMGPLRDRILQTIRWLNPPGARPRQDA